MPILSTGWTTLAFHYPSGKVKWNSLYQDKYLYVSSVEVRLWKLMHTDFIAPIKCATGFLYHHLSSNITLQLPIVDNTGEAWHWFFFLVDFKRSFFFSPMYGCSTSSGFLSHVRILRIWGFKYTKKNSLIKCFSLRDHYAAKKLLLLSNRWAGMCIHFSCIHTDHFLHTNSHAFLRLYIHMSLTFQMSSWTSFSHTCVWLKVKLPRLLVVLYVLHRDLIKRRCPKLRTVLHWKPFWAQWSGRIILLFLCLTVFFYISVKPLHFLQHQITVDSFSICELLWTKTFFL